MLKRTAYFIAAILLITTACRHAENKEWIQQDSEQVKGYEAKGDSTVYGLACDGCDEEKLVILFPETKQDPDTFNIIEALRKGKMFGRPSVGDRIAILLDKEDPKVVVSAINMDVLVGTWVYDVLPEFRHKLDEELLKQLSVEERARIDSIRNSYLIPKEYGINIKADNTVMSVGRIQRNNSLEGESPVVYPEVKRYSEWHICNGRLILTKGMRAGATPQKETEMTKVSNDTAEIITLRRDTMTLRFGDKIQGYRLKPDTLAETN